MEDKRIVFTFKNMGKRDGRKVFVIYSDSLLADEDDKYVEVKAIDFYFTMSFLSKKYNRRNIAVLFDYED